jgi:hypothetical protein
MSTEQAGRSEDPRNLPAVPAAADLESDVLAGQAAGGPPPRAAAGPRPAVVVVQAVLVIIRHDSAKTAARHAAYIPLGAAAVARRLWESRSTARYDRAIRAAQQAGDQKTALEWDARRAEFVAARHERRMQRAESRRATARTLPWFALGVVAVLSAAGVLLAVARHRAADVAEPAVLLAELTADGEFEKFFRKTSGRPAEAYRQVVKAPDAAA